MAVAFEIVPGRGLSETVSVQDRFKIISVAATNDEGAQLEGVPVELAGQTLGDNFLESLDYVDQGVAFYKGQRAKDQCEVTVKVFSLIGRLSDDYKALAERLEAAPKLRHEHIELIYEAGRKGDLFFVAGERLEGETLAEKVERDGALPPSLALQILKNTLGALTALHNRSHIHGDVCPETLFLCRDGTLKLTGINQTRPASEQLTLGGELLGNADYLAPERIDGRNTDPNSDLYSLGHTFYFLLTGRAPFSGNSPIATMICHLNQEPPELQKMSDGISEDFVKIFSKLTGKTYDMRYQDTGQTLADIKYSEDGRGNRIEYYKRNETVEKTLTVVKTSLIGIILVIIIITAFHLISASLLALNKMETPVNKVSVPILPTQANDKP